MICTDLGFKHKVGRGRQGEGSDIIQVGSHGGSDQSGCGGGVVMGLILDIFRW